MKRKLLAMLALILGVSMLALTGCSSKDDGSKGEATPSDTGSSDSTPEGDAVNKDAVTLDDAVALLKAVDCSAGDEFSASEENENWRSELRRYDGEKVVAVGYCVGGLGSDYQMKQFTGDIPALAELLSAADEVADPENPVACTLQYETQPNLWLVTDAGEVFVPRWPLDVCTHLQKPKPGEVFTDANLVDLV